MNASYKNQMTSDLYKALEELKPFKDSRNPVLESQYWDVSTEIINRVTKARTEYWEAKMTLQAKANELRHALNMELVPSHGEGSKLPEEKK